MSILRRATVALVSVALVCCAVAPASAGPSGSRVQQQQQSQATLTLTLSLTTGSPAWTWPLAIPHRILREFRAPVSEYADGHRGIDVAARLGDPVYAVADGTVTFAGIVVDRPALSLTHGGGLVSSLEPVTALVGAGDAVHRGQLIGRVASGGHCGSDCVHLGARTYGRYVSPMRYLGEVPHAVLLPAESAALLRQRRDSRRSPGEHLLWQAILRQDEGGQARG